MRVSLYQLSSFLCLLGEPTASSCVLRHSSRNLYHHLTGKKIKMTYSFRLSRKHHDFKANIIFITAAPLLIFSLLNSYLSLHPLDLAVMYALITSSHVLLTVMLTHDVSRSMAVLFVLSNCTATWGLTTSLLNTVSGLTTVTIVMTALTGVKDGPAAAEAASAIMWKIFFTIIPIKGMAFSITCTSTNTGLPSCQFLKSRLQRIPESQVGQARSMPVDNGSRLHGQIKDCLQFLPKVSKVSREVRYSCRTCRILYQARRHLSLGDMINAIEQKLSVGAAVSCEHGMTDPLEV